MQSHLPACCALADLACFCSVLLKCILFCLQDLTLLTLLGHSSFKTQPRRYFLSKAPTQHTTYYTNTNHTHKHHTHSNHIQHHAAHSPTHTDSHTHTHTPSPLPTYINTPRQIHTQAHNTFEYQIPITHTPHTRVHVQAYYKFKDTFLSASNAS